VIPDESDRCAYVYPGNRRRCGRDRIDHGEPALDWRNVTADGHDFVPPPVQTDPINEVAEVRHERLRTPPSGRIY
jgi:hypothetical protein